MKFVPLSAFLLDENTVATRFSGSEGTWNFWLFNPSTFKLNLLNSFIWFDMIHIFFLLFEIDPHEINVMMSHNFFHSFFFYFISLTFSLSHIFLPLSLFLPFSSLSIWSLETLTSDVSFISFLTLSFIFCWESEIIMVLYGDSPLERPLFPHTFYINRIWLFLISR